MMTELAFSIRKAASSAEPALTGRVSLAPAAAAPEESVPKPPRMTLKIERFMPLHMM